MALTQCKKCNTEINYRGISICPGCGAAIEVVESKSGKHFFIFFNLLMLFFLISNLSTSYQGDNFGAGMRSGFAFLLIIVVWIAGIFIVLLTRKK